MLLPLFSAYTVFLIALASPGPDFAVTVQMSVRHGRRAGIFTALGIACGNLLHIVTVNIGLGAIIAHSIVAFSMMKYAAAAYLVYIGLKALRSTPYAAEKKETAGVAQMLPDTYAFRRGAVTAMLNPKAALFWLSYFALALDPRMPLPVLLGFVALLLATAAVWFSMVACFLSQARIREKFMRLGHWFDRATGIVLIALGVKVAFAQR